MKGPPFVTAIRAAFARPDRCRPCRHFCADPFAIEAALPGLGAFASTHASTWEANGLCTLQGRITNGAKRCVDYASPAGDPGQRHME